jgi:phosphatidylglycerophosphate synthase
MNTILNTILYYIFLRLRISANGVDIISVVVIYLSAVFVFLDINVLKIIGLLFFVLVDVWDIVDGQIARAHNMESHKGYYFDLVAQAISHDVIIIVIALTVLNNYTNPFVISIAILLIFNRVFRIDLIFKGLGFVTENKVSRQSESLKRKKVTQNTINNVKKITNKIYGYIKRHYIKYILTFFILELYLLEGIILFPLTALLVIQLHSNYNKLIFIINS